ncbi:MAG: T9SS type A sorting domain-containing protein [Bacteroidetes bacterium]|nr:T9SS type A sorting domain-containing protein [Bacteroidota bacterium]
MKKNIFLSFCLAFFIPFVGKSIEHATITLLNPSSTATTIEFDVFLVNDGTTALKLAGYQFGINFSATILNGGTPGSTSYEYLSGTRDVALNNLTLPSTQYNNAQLKVSSTPVTLLNAVSLMTGFQYKLGRFRFTNTVPWLSGSMPDLQFQLLSSPGKTHALVIAYVDASITNTPMGVANTFLGTVNTTAGFTLGAPLPVQLLNFSGNKAQAGNQLMWSTCLEINNLGFNLQYSDDGIYFQDLQFIKSKAIDGNCNTVSEYQYFHKMVSSGHHYYRLEQIDIDGNKSYEGNIIDLYRTNDGQITIFPNPTSTQLTIQVVSIEAQKVSIQLSDLQGHILYHTNNMFTAGLQDLPIDISKFANGNYMLTVSTNDKVLLQEKITKIN